MSKTKGKARYKVGDLVRCYISRMWPEIRPGTIAKILDSSKMDIMRGGRMLYGVRAYSIHPEGARVRYFARASQLRKV